MVFSENFIESLVVLILTWKDEPVSSDACSYKQFCKAQYNQYWLNWVSAANTLWEPQATVKKLFLEMLFSKKHKTTQLIQ